MNALTLWRMELALNIRGQRADTASTWRLDALWRAACCEASAADFELAGLPTLAHERSLAAAAHIVSAAEVKREGGGG